MGVIKLQTQNVLNVLNVKLHLVIYCNIIYVQLELFNFVKLRRYISYHNFTLFNNYYF